MGEVKKTLLYRDHRTYESPIIAMISYFGVTTHVWHGFLWTLSIMEEIELSSELTHLAFNFLTCWISCLTMTLRCWETRDMMSYNPMFESHRWIMSLTMTLRCWETWYMMSYNPMFICCLMNDVNVITT